MAHLIPPMVFSTFTSPITLLAWLLTFFSSSLFRGMASLKVLLRSGSATDAYDLEEIIESGLPTEG